MRRGSSLAMFVRLLFCVLVWQGIGCRSAPITGRRQLVVLPEQQEITLGLTSFQEITSKEPPSTNQHYVEMVQRVGQRIAAVSGRPDYQWEFRVIASPTQNAFCLPGGKVAVYEGIIPICENEAGLAVVMSHEIGHALARHGGERISQSYAVEGVKQAVSYLSQTQDAVRQEMIMKAYGVGTQYGVILPYSRKHESEADHIGLMLMAKAGYTPEEAPRFWQRFAASHKGNQPIEFLSTHPTDQRRSQDLAALLPQAMQIYLQASNRYDLGDRIVVAPTAPAATPSSTPNAAPATTTPFAPVIAPATASVPAAEMARVPGAFGSNPPPALTPPPAVDGWMPRSDTLRR